MFNYSIKSLLSIVLLTITLQLCVACFPAKRHPSPVNTVKVWSKTVVIHEFKDPQSIKVIQDAFARAKKIGNTRTHLRTPTHSIDLSAIWLIDLNSGEIAVLSMAIRDVYQIEPADLKLIQQLVKSGQID